MAVTLLTPTVIAREAAMQLENNLIMGNLVYRQFENQFTKIGASITYRKPVKFTVRDGKVAQVQDVTEGSDTITVNKQKGVDWKFSAIDLTLTIEEYSERYIKPAMIVLANQVDLDICALYKDIYWNYGTPGSTPSRFADLGGVAAMLDNGAVPPDSRNLVLNPTGHWSIADGLKGLFIQNKVDAMITRGYLGTVAGFDLHMDQNVYSHTKGTASALYVMDGATEYGTHVTLKTGTGTWVVGDIVTFAGCYAVNPISKQTLGYLQPFTVTAASAGGAGELYISPELKPVALYPADGNVSTYPTDSGAVTVLSANHIANLAFHKNAFALVMVPIEEPDSCAWKARVTHNGISMLITKAFDIINFDEIIRIDVLYGVKSVYPELAARLLG